MKESLSYKKNKKRLKQIKQSKINKKLSDINANQNINSKKKTIEPYITKINSNNNGKINNSITLDKQKLSSFSFMSTVSQENQTPNKSLNSNKNNNYLIDNLKKTQPISKITKKNVNFSNKKKNISKTIHQTSPPMKLDKELDKFQNGINNIMKIIEDFENEYIISNKQNFIKDQFNKITLNKSYFNKNKLYKNNKNQNNNKNVNSNQDTNNLLTNIISSDKNLNDTKMKMNSNNNNIITKISNDNPHDRRINYSLLISQKLKSNNNFAEINNKKNAIKSSKILNSFRKNNLNYSSRPNDKIISTKDQKKNFFKNSLRKNIDYMLNIRKTRNKKGFSNSVHIESGFNNNIILNKIKNIKSVKHKSNIINSKSILDIL